MLCGVAAHAANLKVFPVRLALSAREPIATLTVHNAGDEPALLQMQVFAWSQKDGEDVLEPTRVVLANPGAFELAPGADQIARFGLQSSDPEREQSYRVLIQEVPRHPPDRPGEVITLLRVSLPIFTRAEHPQSRIAWKVRPVSGGQAEVQVDNLGDQHVQLTEVQLIRPDGQVLGREKLSAYVLAGTTRRLRMACASPLRPNETLTLKAATDQGELQASVVSEAGADARALR